MKIFVQHRLDETCLFRISPKVGGKRVGFVCPRLYFVTSSIAEGLEGDSAREELYSLAHSIPMAIRIGFKVTTKILSGSSTIQTGLQQRHVLQLGVGRVIIKPILGSEWFGTSMMLNRAECGVRSRTASATVTV